MRCWVGSASLFLAVALVAPAEAATIVLLPPAGSMSQPRIFSDGAADDWVYVCSSPSDLRNGRCSVQKGSTPRRGH